MSLPVCYCQRCHPDRNAEGVEELWRIQCHVRYQDAQRIVALDGLAARREALDAYERLQGQHLADLLRGQVSVQWSAMHPAGFAR